MRVGWFLFLVLITACGGSPDGGGPDGGWDTDSEPVEPVTVVEVVPVERGAVSDVLVTSASVESEASADLYPVASGIVLSIHKDEGDAVRKGEVLAVVDNASIDAGSERSRAELERMEREYARLQALFDQGAISERELTDAGYTLQGAKTGAREATRTQGQTRITAPFDGVVATRDIRIGELASGGRRAFQVVDLDQLRVVAALPEREVSRIELGQRARLVSAYDTEVFAQGSVTRIAPVVDTLSGTFRVTVGLDPGQNSLRPGQFVSVELEVGRHEHVLITRRKAVVYEDGMPVVYRMIVEPEEEPEDEDENGEDEEAGGGLFANWKWPFGGEETEDTEAEEDEEEQIVYVAERVAVEVGLMDAQVAEIVTGLEAGDQVIAVGQSNLKDGAVVKTPAMALEDERRAAEEAAAAEDDDEGEG